MSEHRHTRSKHRTDGRSGKASGEAAPISPPLNASLVRSLSDATSVGTIMTRQVMGLAPEASVSAVTEMFLDRDLSAAPVVDAGWLPLAMVSKTDLLRYWAERKPLSGALCQQPGGAPHVPAQPLGAPDFDAHSAAKPPIEGGDAAAKVRLGAAPRGAGVQSAPGADADAAKVAEVTLPYVLSLHEEAPISVAAALMAQQSVHRLPITSRSGEVIGVVSTLDIVRWLAQSTGMGAGG